MRYRDDPPNLRSSISQVGSNCVIISMKEEILRLRREGKSYNEIMRLTGASKGTIAYHCSQKVRANYHNRSSRWRRKIKESLKLKMGGKCQLCGYSKCLAALDFHHNGDEKNGSISQMIMWKGKQATIAETKLCILVCANCHREIHDGYKYEI